MKRKFETKQKVEEYLQVVQELNGKVSDAIAIAVIQEIAKDRRTQQINGNGGQTNGSGATEKQKALLDKLNVSYDEEISKADASRLLDSALQREG